MTASIHFRKMNGLGNDFVVLDARRQQLALNAAQIASIADRSRGIGCDQVIALEPSDFADVFMRIWNADGGEVGACGNAARCVAALLVAERGSPHVSIETESGMLAATVAKDGRVTIDMGAPRFNWNEIPLSQPFDDTREIELPSIGDPALSAPSVVNVGNPHCIFFVDDVAAHDLARFGPLLEHHPLFPERANISLAQVTGPDSLRLRTWER
ncbi:MAG TPA: diaminopimelate epimerase, partial [Methyloceanibacter sp.]